MRNMNIKYLTSLVTGVLECILFSGILFGWPSLRYVLEKDGYFSGLCEEEAYSATTATTAAFNTPTGNLALFARSGSETTTIDGEGRTVSFVGATIPSSTVGKEVSNKYPSCNAQAEMLNLVFTISSSLLSFSALINGYIFDTYGTWVARIISVLLFTIGCIFMAISSLSTSWMLFPSLACIAIGGILMLVTNLQIGNLFGKFRSSIITLMSGALDSSSFVFLIFKMLYDAGASLTGIFHVVAWCTILLWLRTFLLLPRKHIPFPISKGYDFGIVDCGCRKNKSEHTELALVSSPGENNIEENEALTKELVLEVKGGKTSSSLLACLKKSLFWGNVAHFSLLQLRNYFFMGTLYEWLSPMTSSKEELSKYLNVFGICQLFGVFFAPFNGLLIDTVTRILYKSTDIKELVPLKAVTYSAITTTLLGTLFSVIVAIPSLPLQYLSFILQVIFRSFLYGGSMSFIAVAFPGEHFGKLYGITMFVGGCVNLLQFPLFTLVLRKMGGNFLAINIIFILVSLLTLAHPLNIYRCCRNKATSKMKSIVRGEIANS